MALDDERIERYSRQLILAEVGPRGQERLLAARAAVVGTGVAAECVVAYLAAAGVGWIACDDELRDAVDPDARDVTLARVADAARDGADATVVIAETIAAAAHALAPWSERPTHALWIAGGRAGGTPPCACCAVTAAPAVDPPGELGRVRDTLLATVVATETVKALLGVGTPLTGRVLTYDPATAGVDVAAADRTTCTCGRV